MSYRHKCENCNYMCNVKSNLLRHFKTIKHIKNVENNVKFFICDVCNHSYKHRQSLHKHQMICKNKNTQCVEYKQNDEYNNILDTIQRVFGITLSSDKNVIIENTNPIIIRI